QDFRGLIVGASGRCPHRLPKANAAMSYPTARPRVVSTRARPYGEIDRITITYPPSSATYPSGRSVIAMLRSVFCRDLDGIAMNHRDVNTPPRANLARAPPSARPADAAA